MQGKRKFRDEIKKCSVVCFIDMIARVLIRFFWVTGELESKVKGTCGIKSIDITHERYA